MKKLDANNEALPIRQIIIGILVSLITAAIGAGVVAYLTGEGTWDESNMKMAMVLMSLVASIAGCLTAVLSANGRILVVAAAVAAGYFLVLLLGNLLLLDGGVKGALWTILMIVAGATVAILIGVRGFRTKKQRKLRIQK